jgi:hypothetical protein
MKICDSVGMRWLPVLFLGACSFSPGSYSGNGSSDARMDTMPTSDADTDAILDSFVAPVYPVRMIDIDDTKVAGGPHVDFPVLVSISGAWLKSKANGGDVQRDDGFDIYFSAEQSGATKLAFEVESYDEAAGTLLAWVKIPSLVATTTFYIHYGDPAITTNQAMAPAVWSGGYELVTHMTTSADATGKAAVVNASTGAATAGRIGSALTFNGTTHAIDYGSDAEVDNVFTAGGALEAWISPASAGEAGYGRILSKENMTGWLFTVDNNNVTSSFSFQHNGSTEAGGWSGPASTLAMNVWHQIIVVYNKDDAANNAVLYVDGASVTSTRFIDAAGTMQSDADSTLYVGNRPAGDRAFNGLIDEVRVSSVSRSSDWIGTQYRNQSDPGTFLTVGTAL